MPAPAELLGTWRLERRVHDRMTDTFGRVHGTLTLTETELGVRWFERGRFVWAGRGYDSTRELRLLPGPDGRWTMRFADGRDFHPWRPGEIVEHPCRADLYRGLVDVTPTLLRTLWDVTGPAKDQRIVTRCVRLPD